MAKVTVTGRFRSNLNIECKDKMGPIFLMSNDRRKVAKGWGKMVTMFASQSKRGLKVRFLVTVSS